MTNPDVIARLCGYAPADRLAAAISENIMSSLNEVAREKKEHVIKRFKVRSTLSEGVTFSGVHRDLLISKISLVIERVIGECEPRIKIKYLRCKSVAVDGECSPDLAVWDLRAALIYGGMFDCSVYYYLSDSFFAVRRIGYEIH